MRGLIDTHVFLWQAEDSDRLSKIATDFIDDPSNTLFLSVASVWEIVIKTMTGKLKIDKPIGAILSRLPTAGITLLPVNVDHVLAVQNLPDIHKDPFDRLLVAQASVEGAVFVTADAIFDQYPVTRVW